MDKFIENLLLNHFVNDRKVHHHLVPVNDRLQLGLVNLLDDERNGNDNMRLDVGKRLHDNLRARHTCKEMHMGTDGHLEQELEHHAVHVCRRQH